VDRKLPLAKFVRVDENRHAAMSLLQEHVYHPNVPDQYYPTFNEDGFPVYEADILTVRHHISRRPDWFKLYQSRPVVVEVPKPSGAIESVTFYPWTYRKVSKPKLDAKGKPVLDSENDEQIMESVIEWYEDYECKTVTAPVSGQTASDNSRLSELEKSLAAATSRIEELAKSLKEEKERNSVFHASIVQKDARIRSLETEVEGYRKQVKQK
jgi:hypothetical protein